jgi:hypothetical protein
MASSLSARGAAPGLASASRTPGRVAALAPKHAAGRARRGMRVAAALAPMGRSGARSSRGGRLVVRAMFERFTEKAIKVRQQQRSSGLCALHELHMARRIRCMHNICTGAAACGRKKETDVQRARPSLIVHRSPWLVARLRCMPVHARQCVRQSCVDLLYRAQTPPVRWHTAQSVSHGMWPCHGALAPAHVRALIHHCLHTHARPDRTTGRHAGAGGGTQVRSPPALQRPITTQPACCASYPCTADVEPATGSDPPPRRSVPAPTTLFNHMHLNTHAPSLHLPPSPSVCGLTPQVGPQLCRD